MLVPIRKVVVNLKMAHW